MFILMAEAFVSNMQIGYIHSNIRASALEPSVKMLQGQYYDYRIQMHNLITGEIINQNECKSTEAVFRLYGVQIAKVYLHKKR